MRRTFRLLPILALLLVASCSTKSTPTTPMKQSFYDLSAPLLTGEPAELSQYRGKVVLVVNVASECGLTPQYAGLQKLHAELEPRGFTVLGFPSNDFGGQEPGSPAEIAAFCDSRYQVTFPMHAKVQTKAGAGQSPVYTHLDAATGDLPSWNFGKYLIARDGRVLGYYGSRIAPNDTDLRKAIDAALAEPAG